MFIDNSSLCIRFRQGQGRFCIAVLMTLCIQAVSLLQPSYGRAAPPDSMDLCPVINLLLAGNSSCHTSGDADSYKYDLVYEGLPYYAPAMGSMDYQLPQLSDKEFNNLSAANKLLVADKLLATLFFGLPRAELENLIDSGNFLCTIRSGLTKRQNVTQQIEQYILDDQYFVHEEYYDNEIHDILARFYAMEYLDEYFLHNWIAYILTQTIMFSPAEELDSAHLPDVANVYNWLVMDMEEDISMRYSTFLHMGSLENWRRFRSPEDNGREMLEIFLLDFDDVKVPVTATALQNWYLDEDHDSLVIGLNENTIPLSLFGTTIYNGFDFYRELAKTDAFIRGVTTRLVDFFFQASAVAQKQRVTTAILNSQPRRWQDILLQLVFSKEYLLYSDREKSAEELFYSLAKKMYFKHRRHTFRYVNDDLEDMNQSSMKYKLGKLERTPLDTLSFANYHNFVRDQLVFNHVCGDAINDYDAWNSDGWRPEFVEEQNFTLIDQEPEGSMISFIQYLFRHIIQRQATQTELDMFLDEMLRDSRTKYEYAYNLTSQGSNGCYYGRENAAEDILDYLSRLTEFYWFEGVQ